MKIFIRYEERLFVILTAVTLNSSVSEIKNRHKNKTYVVQLYASKWYIKISGLVDVKVIWLKIFLKSFQIVSYTSNTLYGYEKQFKNEGTRIKNFYAMGIKAILHFWYVNKGHLKGE